MHFTYDTGACCTLNSKGKRPSAIIRKSGGDRFQRASISGGAQGSQINSRAQSALRNSIFRQAIRHVLDSKTNTQ